MTELHRESKRSLNIAGARESRTELMNRERSFIFEKVHGQGEWRDDMTLAVIAVSEMVQLGGRL